MHEVNPDIVAIKTAVRHLTARIAQEAQATSQWASLARNRGVAEVGVRLEMVAASLEDALGNAKAIPPLLFEAQESATTEAHSHDH
jgi:hypothetical protein